MALAEELRVEPHVAAFVWEASGGNFDDALEMLQGHVRDSTQGLAGGAAPSPPAAEEEEHVRAPIRPTERQVLAGDPGMVPW